MLLEDFACNMTDSDSDASRFIATLKRWYRITSIKKHIKIIGDCFFIIDRYAFIDELQRLKKNHEINSKYI